MDKQKQIEEMAFIVIDNKTGKEADIGKIALKEDWAKGLMYCDMEGFALLQDGNLVLMDECGRYEYCPSGRFTIIPENAVVLTMEEYTRLKGEEPIMIKSVEPIYLAEIRQLEFRLSEYGGMMNEMRDDLKKARESILQTRKETAEEFAEALKARRFDEYSPYGKSYECVAVSDIDEICKEFTEGKDER